MDGGLSFAQEHEVLDREEFRMTELLRGLHGKAVRQLGSSGGGNHFVEFGKMSLQAGNVLGVPEGNYVALPSHSGSRGLGAAIAKHYSRWHATSAACLARLSTLPGWGWIRKKDRNTGLV